MAGWRLLALLEDELKRLGQALMDKLEVGQVTLNLHENGMIMCDHGASLRDGDLSASHPLGQDCIGNRKRCGRG